MEANVEIARLDGIIEPCNDPKSFNSLVFAVRKNRAVWVVVNLERTLSKVLVDLDPYLMSRIEQLFNKIGEGNKYFSTLDLRSGYRKIATDELDRQKTSTQP